MDMNVLLGTEQDLMLHSITTVTISGLLLGPPLLTQLNRLNVDRACSHVACALIEMSCNT